MPMRRTEDGVGMSKVVRGAFIQQMVNQRKGCALRRRSRAKLEVLGAHDASVHRHMVPDDGHIRRLDRRLVDNLTITHHQNTVREG